MRELNKYIFLNQSYYEDINNNALPQRQSDILMRSSCRRDKKIISHARCPARSFIGKHTAHLFAAGRRRCARG